MVSIPPCENKNKGFLKKYSIYFIFKAIYFNYVNIQVDLFNASINYINIFDLFLNFVMGASLRPASGQ